MQLRATIARRTLGGALLALSWAAASPLAAQPYTVQTERAVHPNLAHALDAMNAALRDLEAAPDNFGGHKGIAIDDLRRAMLSTKRALYFRLRLDDQRLNALH